METTKFKLESQNPFSIYLTHKALQNFLIIRFHNAYQLFDKIPLKEEEEEKMYVVKRNGKQETVHFDKITARLKKLSYGLSSDHCDPVLVAQKACAGVYKGVTTSQLDELAAETSAAMTANHPDYASVSSLFTFLIGFRTC